MESRSSSLVTDGKNLEFVDGYEENISSYTIGPIIANGDPIELLSSSQKRSLLVK